MAERPSPVARFASFGVSSAWDRTFNDPRVVRTADTLGDVFPLLSEAETAARNGAWVALAISYHAAPAFDSALPAAGSPSFPLVWMAVFDQPSHGEEERRAPKSFSLSRLEDDRGLTEYRAAVNAIRAHIERGDTYQVNYTFPLHGTFAGDAFSCFRAVGPSQGAAYSAYLDIGSHRILSFSPELFFERRGDRISTRPMKGTTPRGRWLEEDGERALALAASVKDRAENVMIVDLLRSDLGKVAVVGSVAVPELFAVEPLTRVLQMSSSVTCIQRPGTSLTDILAALFPCGSVTGAPKPRSMEIIAALEPEPRGMYTGAIGLLEPGGDAVFNVAIRTLVIDNTSGKMAFGVGGGITWDSTVEGEYEETRLKANFLTEPWPRFELLETLLLEGGEFYLRERHLSRARKSARYFGFDWSERAVCAALEKVAVLYPSGRWRVRVVIDSSGACRAEAGRFPEMTGSPRRVKFASNPVDDRDPLLFHKTTARLRYDEELARLQPCDDVIFWNCREEVTESTIANIVLRLDGRDWTPPRSAGLVAGTLREELISKGELFERTIMMDELAGAESFELINSVRGRGEAAFV